MTAFQLAEVQGDDTRGEAKELALRPKPTQSEGEGSVTVILYIFGIFLMDDTDSTCYRTELLQTAKWVSKNPSIWLSWPNKPNDMKVSILLSRNCS